MQAIELVVPGTTTPDPVRTKAVLASTHAQGVVTLGATSEDLGLGRQRESEDIADSD